MTNRNEGESVSNSAFTRQWAIQMPNGELWRNANGWYGAPSIKQMLGQAAALGPIADESPPRVFDTLNLAQERLDDLRRNAKALGVDDWCGVIVQRIATPFSTADPGAELIAGLEEWLGGQDQ